MGSFVNDPNPYSKRQLAILSGKLSFEEYGESALASLLYVALNSGFDDDVNKAENLIIEKAKARYKPKAFYTTTQQQLLNGEIDVTKYSWQSRRLFSNLIVQAESLGDDSSVAKAKSLYHKWVLNAYKPQYSERQLKALEGKQKEDGRVLGKLRKKLLSEGRFDEAYQIGCELADNKAARKKKKSEKNNFTHTAYEIGTEYSEFHKSILDGTIGVYDLIGNEDTLLSLLACTTAFGTKDEQLRARMIADEVRLKSKEFTAQQLNNFQWTRARKRKRPTPAINLTLDEALDIIDAHIYPAKMRE